MAIELSIERTAAEETVVTRKRKLCNVMKTAKRNGILLLKNAVRDRVLEVRGLIRSEEPRRLAGALESGENGVVA